ncbi:uncharacterized protein LOC113340325 [Papaver somniferum]|uniref:uncharacterized protein LOC113340325 n=1 Tax=Papaver somniferum TaxID=3469 RepID=UPI000E6FCAAF|nr:uncharacterized protein LOC113340325 [Papaver somniferum]
MISGESRLGCWSLSSITSSRYSRGSSLLHIYNFSEHLEQLRKSDAVAFSSNAVDDGDRHKCPLILSKHTVDYYIWRQKHLFDSLCTMSRESAWLLKKLKDSPFSSPSSIDQSSKILDIILVYILKFKESKELLDRYLHDECCHRSVDPIRLVMDTNKILVSFGGRIKNLQEQGVKTKSVAETLLKCFVDVVDMSDKRGNPYGDTRSSLQCVFSEVAKETSELIYEAVEKLKSVKHSDLTGGGSPLGCIALWKIIFESSLINLRLDCICEKYSETVKLGVKPFDTATNNQLDQIRLSINQLLTVGKSILVEFMDMQKAVAEVTYTLGDAFTTGGAGMRGSSQDRRPRTSIWKVAEVPYTLGAGKQDDQVMNFNLDDFPWDKHNVPEFSKTGPTHKDEIF